MSSAIPWCLHHGGCSTLANNGSLPGPVIPAGTDTIGARRRASLLLLVLCAAQFRSKSAGRNRTRLLRISTSLSWPAARRSLTRRHPSSSAADGARGLGGAVQESQLLTYPVNPPP